MARPTAGPEMPQEIQHRNLTGWPSEGWSCRTEGRPPSTGTSPPPDSRFPWSSDLAGFFSIQAALTVNLGTLL